MPVEKEFGADADLKRLYQVYLALVVVGGFLWWMIPVAVYVIGSAGTEFVGAAAALSFFVFLAVVAGFVLNWIPKFHSSIHYVLEEDKIVVSKGVWWKTQSFVQYNRITNVNVYQGPISRHFGLGKLSVQTAGFSGASSSGHKTAEAEILGIKNFDEIRDTIMSSAKGLKPTAIETEAEFEASKDINLQILEELRQIRKTLEK